MRKIETKWRCFQRNSLLAMCMVELKSEKTKMRKTNKETTNGERRELEIHLYSSVSMSTQMNRAKI